MNKFIIPFYYTFYTRIKGKSKRVAYLFTFILPIYIYIVAFNNKFTAMDFIASILAFIGLMSVYEIGYINNDVVTTRNEKNPTLRLTKDEMSYAWKHLKSIKTIKYITAFVMLIILIFLDYNAVYYIIGLILIDLVYAIHNLVRDKKSIITFFCLSLLRYITVPLVFCSAVGTSVNKDFNLYAMIGLFVLIIALPRTIEKAAEKKYKIETLKIIKERTTEFRVIYYILASILGAFLFKLGYCYLVLSLYYLCYRVLIWIGFLMKERKRS